ncbi:hypothetical protein TNCV_1049641 [Trichonephila clavipes]|nr:hypothetical protein TNCV_1049641 [Trichonephila clavipes]
MIKILENFEFYRTATAHCNILVAGPAQTMKLAFLFCSNRGRSLEPMMSPSNGSHHILTLEVTVRMVKKGNEKETATGTLLTYQELYSNKKKI